MAKWIEDFKKIYEKATEEDKQYLKVAFQDKLWEKGYTFEKSEKILKYIGA